MKFFFHERNVEDRSEPCFVVSKRESLPDGVFPATPFKCDAATLFFVYEDDFTIDERQEAYEYYRANLAGNESPDDGTDA